MIEIPIFISSTCEKTPQKIPKTIFQTFATRQIHPKIYDHIIQMLRMNPEYDYRFITDEEGIQLIQTHFSERVLRAFKLLTLGAAKGDFIRYIVMYLFGGVYLDLDASIQVHLNTIIDPTDEYVFFINGDINLEQFCFMIRPRHSLLLKVIEEMVCRIENKEPNIFKATGPTLFNDVIYNAMKGSNIYDTNMNVSIHDRSECYSNNNRFMGGRLVLRYGEIEKQIMFRIEDGEQLLYENGDSNRYFTYDPSTNIHYISRLF